MSYQFGELIFVRFNDEHDWWREIFVSEANGVVFTAADKKHLEEIMSGYSAPIPHTNHKQIPKKKVVPYTLETFPLDNSGMVRRKTWDKGLFSTILEVHGLYVRFCISGDFSSWGYKHLAEEYEWLQKDGTTTPFGIEVDDE